MNTEIVRELLQRRPFEPLAIRLSGGETYEIRHPENVALGKARLVIVDPETDRMAVCSLLHITSIETLQAT
jgi:hypothetical protein